MSWNYRVLAHQQKDEVYLQIHEVYYTDNIPDSYTENPITIGSEDLEGIEWSIDKIKECIKKPILWAGGEFPKEYNPT